MRSLASVCVACSALWSTQCGAWDEEPGVFFPRLMGSLPGGWSIGRVSAQLSGERVEVRFMGDAGKPWKSMKLWSYSGPYEWQGEAADWPDAHFSEAGISFNGNQLQSTQTAYAWLNGREVTAELRRARVDPMWSTLVSAQLSSRTNRLSRAALPYFSVDPVGGPGFPLWATSVVRSWDVRGGNAGPFTLILQYFDRPRKQLLALDGAELDAAILAHCGDPRAVREKVARENPGATEVVVRVSFVPTRIGNMPTVSPELKVEAGREERSQQTLACGLGKSAITGAPSISGARLATGLGISVLRLLPVQ